MANTLRNVAALCLTHEKPCFTSSILSSQLLSRMNAAHRFLLPSYHFLGAFFQSLPPKSSPCIFPYIISSTELDALNFPLLPETELTWCEDSSSPANAIFCKIQTVLFFFQHTCYYKFVTFLFWKRQSCVIQRTWHLESDDWSLHLGAAISDFRYWEIQCTLWVPVFSSIKWINNPYFLGL